MPLISQSSHQADLSEAADPAQPAAPASPGSSSPAKTPFKRAAPARDTHSPLLSPSQMRQWQLRHEGFAEALAARLSLFLRAELTLALSGIQSLTYQRMTESWPEPAHFTLFKTEPLRGVSILQIPTPLGLCIADRLMGGSGCSGPVRQEMGAIENALLEQVKDTGIRNEKPFEYWNEILIQNGTYIHEQRQKFINYLNNPIYQDKDAANDDWYEHY